VPDATPVGEVSPGTAADMIVTADSQLQDEDNSRGLNTLRRRRGDDNNEDLPARPLLDSLLEASASAAFVAGVGYALGLHIAQRLPDEMKTPKPSSISSFQSEATVNPRVSNKNAFITPIMANKTTSLIDYENLENSNLGLTGLVDDYVRYGVAAASIDIGMDKDEVHQTTISSNEYNNSSLGSSSAIKLNRNNLKAFSPSGVTKIAKARSEVASLLEESTVRFHGVGTSTASSTILPSSSSTANTVISSSMHSPTGSRRGGFSPTSSIPPMNTEGHSLMTTNELPMIYSHNHNDFIHHQHHHGPMMNMVPHQSMYATTTTGHHPANPLFSNSYSNNYYGSYGNTHPVQHLTQAYDYQPTIQTNIVHSAPRQRSPPNSAQHLRHSNGMIKSPSM